MATHDPGSMTRAFIRLTAVNLAVIVAATAALLALGEIALRLALPSSSSGSIYLYTLATPRYKVMKPNAAVTAWGKELRTNELGFRDAAVPEKPPGELRIVVLGDSFTVSAGVEQRDIWTTLLQKRLREKYPRVRVLNRAVGGYNIVQYRMVLEEVGLRLKPDLLLVALFPDNDFSLEGYDGNFRAASGASPEAQPWHEELYVYRAYLRRVAARLKGWLGEPGQRQAGDDRAGWDANVAALQAIADIARREQLPLEVALLPHTWNFERERALFARVNDVCRGQQLACVDLRAAFAARRLDEASLRLNLLDAHPNENYNAAVAEELAPRLARLVEAIESRRGLQPVRLE